MDIVSDPNTIDTSDASVESLEAARSRPSKHKKASSRVSKKECNKQNQLEQTDTKEPIKTCKQLPKLGRSPVLSKFSSMCFRHRKIILALIMLVAFLLFIWMLNAHLSSNYPLEQGQAQDVAKIKDQSLNKNETSTQNQSPSSDSMNELSKTFSDFASSCEQGVMVKEFTDNINGIWMTKIGYPALAIEQTLSKPQGNMDPYHIRSDNPTVLEKIEKEFSASIVTKIENLSLELKIFLKGFFKGFMKLTFDKTCPKHDKTIASTFFKLIKMMNNTLSRWFKHFDFIKYSRNHVEFFEEAKRLFDKIMTKTKQFVKQKINSRDQKVLEINMINEIYQIYKTSDL